MQLAAWRALVILEPAPNLAKLWLGRFREFLSIYPGLPGVLDVAARMHLLAESSEAEEWANRWVVEAGTDPSARLCRMAVLLRQGKVSEAVDDGMVAVEHSLDADTALRQIVRLAGEAASVADPGSHDGLRAMASSFQRLIGTGLSGVGGGR